MLPFADELDGDADLILQQDLVPSVIVLVVDWSTRYPDISLHAEYLGYILKI